MASRTPSLDTPSPGSTRSPERAQLPLVILFLVAISLPLAANLAGMDGADPDAEKRTLAPFPQLDRSLRSVREFPIAVDRWFDDHFGFRSLLVRWYGETRLMWLGVSPSTTVVRGRDGWLFYGDDGAIEDYAREVSLTPAALRDWRESVAGSREWLRDRGIAFVFTIAPDKHVIYPEMMPDTLRRMGGADCTDQVLGALAGSGVATVDVRPALVAAKPTERLFHVTDTHWNDRGAFVAYQQIIDAVRAQVPSVPPAWSREDFEPVARRVGGLDLAGMLGLKHVLEETDLTLVPRRARRAHVVEPPNVEPTSEEARIVTEIPGSSLPRAVIFRDSFVSPMVPFLSEHFSRAVYVWENNFDSQIVLREHPDVVIQEIVGRHLTYVTPYSDVTELRTEK